jgi:hypothetical protein
MAKEAAARAREAKARNKNKTKNGEIGSEIVTDTELIEDWGAVKRYEAYEDGLGAKRRTISGQTAQF